MLLNVPYTLLKSFICLWKLFPKNVDTNEFISSHHEMIIYNSLKTSILFYLLFCYSLENKSVKETSNSYSNLLLLFFFFIKRRTNAETTTTTKTFYFIFTYLQRSHKNSFLFHELSVPEKQSIVLQIRLNGRRRPREGLEESRNGFEVHRRCVVCENGAVLFASLEKNSENKLK